MSEYAEAAGPEGGITHHVVFTISGTEYGYMCRGIEGYQRVDASDFAPKTSSGTLQYSDLHVWQVWAQDFWDHGFGFMKWSDDRGYHSTGDGVDTRHHDIAMLATQFVNSESAKSIKKFVEFNGDVYGLYNTNNGVRKFTVATSTWADTTEVTGTMLDGLNIGSYLVVCPNGARMRKMNAAGTWSNVGVDGANAPTDIAHVCLHGGYFWASEDGKNFLHYASETDVSDLEGNGMADTGCIQVGPGDIPIVNLISFNSNLYVAREDGIWLLPETNFPIQIIDSSRERHTQNFEAMAAYQGRLYFGIRQRMYAYTGSTLIDVTPARYTDVFPYNEYGRFKFMIPMGKYLYVIAGNNETTAEDTLLAFNGTSWFKLWDVATDYVVRAANLTPIDDRIWICHTKSGSFDTDYYQMQTLSDLPYANFDTAANHYLYSSKFDAGFTDIAKSFHSVTLRTQSLTANVKIEVSYQIDESGTWTSLGTFVTSPVEEIDFPATTTGKIIQFRFDFITNSATLSPILDTFILRYLLRPDTIWAYQMTLYLADDQVTLNGDVERTYTAHQKYDALISARDSVSPMTMEDPMGDSHTVYVSSVQFMGYSFRESKGAGQEIEWMVRVGCIDAD